MIIKLKSLLTENNKLTRDYIYNIAKLALKSIYPNIYKNCKQYKYNDKNFAGVKFCYDIIDEEHKRKFYFEYVVEYYKSNEEILVITELKQIPTGPSIQFVKYKANDLFAFFNKGNHYEIENNIENRLQKLSPVLVPFNDNDFDKL